MEKAGEVNDRTINVSVVAMHIESENLFFCNDLFCSLSLTKESHNFILWDGYDHTTRRTSKNLLR